MCGRLRDILLGHQQDVFVQIISDLFQGPAFFELLEQALGTGVLGADLGLLVRLIDVPRLEQHPVCKLLRLLQGLIDDLLLRGDHRAALGAGAHCELLHDQSSAAS